MVEPTAEPTTVVALSGVVAVLGGFPVLAGVDLEVRRGEILLVAGPNGAGKTSLLRLCAGLLPVERGSATVLGHDLAVDRLGVRRHVGLLGHSNGLYADLTVAELIERYWQHVETYYHHTDGTPTGEVQANRYALRSQFVVRQGPGQ